MGTVFLCYTSQKAEVNQKEPVPCLKQNLIPRCLVLNPQKGILYFLTDYFSASSTSEALLHCIRTAQGRKSPPWPYLSWALALQGFVHVFNHLHKSNSSALSTTVTYIVLHMHWSLQDCILCCILCCIISCILCCIISCNALHCHWLTFYTFLQLLEQTGWFMMGREHYLCSWSHFGLFHSFLFNHVLLWFFSISEGFRLILLSSPLWDLYKSTGENFTLSQLLCL